MRPDRSGERGNALLIAIVLFLVIAGAAAWFLLGVSAPPSGAPNPPAPTGASSPVDADPAPAIEPAPAPAPAAAEAKGDAESPIPAPAAPAATRRGRVVGPDGTPIEGASVRILTQAPAGFFAGLHYVAGGEILLLSEKDADAPQESAIVEAPVVRTDALGEFSFPDPAPGALHVSAPGHSPSIRWFSPDGGLVAEDERMHGHAPRDLAGIRASAERMAAETREALVRLESGTPEPPDPPFIEIRLSPATLLRGLVTSSADGRPAAGADVVAISGAEGGIAAMIAASTGDRNRCRVNDAGEYGILISQPGEVRVGAQSGASDFAPMPIDAWVRQVIVRGDLEHRIDLAMSPGGVLEGRLLSMARLPIEGADIQIYPDLDVMRMSSAAATGDFSPRHVEADATGEFRAGGLALGRAYRVIARAEGHARGSAVSAKLEPSSPTAWVEIPLVRGSTISGSVVTEAGAPAAGLSIRLMPDLSELMRDGLGAALNADVSPTESGEDGAFAIEHVPAGKYRLTAGANPLEWNPLGEQEGEEVEVDGVNDIAGIVLIAAPEADESAIGDLSGRVVDGEGNPLPGVTIVVTGELAPTESPAVPAGASEEEVRAALAALAEGEEATVTLVTDAAGRFSAPGMATAGMQVRATLPGYSEATEFLAGGQTEVEIVLESVGMIRGRVTIADGSPPPVPFEVAAEAVGAEEAAGLEASMMRMMGQGFDGESGEEDGTFVLTEVPTGAVEVVARAPGYAPARSRTIEVRPGAAIDGIELVLTRGATIAGTVRDPDGSLLSGARVICLSAAEASGFGDMMAQMMPALFAGDSGVVTASDGSYEIAHLSPGEYQLRAMHPSFARSDAVTITVRAEEVKSAPPIALLRGGIIEGKVVRADQPAAGIMVQAYSGGAFQQGMTDGEGVFRFENLPEGEFSLIFMNLAGMMRPGGGSGIRSRTVAVAPGETARVDLAFGTGKTVSGVVDPLPPGQMKMVTLRRPGGPAPEEIDPLDMSKYAESARHQVGIAMLGPDGKFSIDDVEPGEYILEIPAMPDDPTDMQAYAAMDRTPHHRRTITVGDSDQHVQIRIDR